MHRLSAVIAAAVLPFAIALLMGPPQVAGWHPRQLRPGEQYTIADRHPMPLFGLCTGGH